MSRRIAFVVNPIAGMGGRVGLKGTDQVVALARSLGAEPVAPRRADEMLSALRRLLEGGESERAGSEDAIRWLTAGGAMGEDALRGAGYAELEVTFVPAEPTEADDTARAVASFLAAGAELIVFCGGDGTARDVSRAVDGRVPVIGVPSGVKMYSGVFGMTPSRTAELVARYLAGELADSDADVLDLDEEAYRRGEWVVRLCCATRTLREPTLVQSAKLMTIESSDRDAQESIAQHLAEAIGREPGVLWLLGPGSTVAALAAHLGVPKTLLGVDALVDGSVVVRDANERKLLDLLDRHTARRLVLSPIGAQGFVLGRGNQQLSPAVVRRIGRDGLVVIATPSKLAATPCLHFDTGDAALDAELCRPAFLPVVTGYHRRRLVRVTS